VLAQQVLLAQIDVVDGPGRGFSVDGWDGYGAPRGRLLDLLGDRRVANSVVLTGDFHTNWVADLKRDFDDPASPVVGTEFVGTSITSGGDGADSAPYAGPVLAANPTSGSTTTSGATCAAP
jgi:alkaline phosphatase D